MTLLAFLRDNARFLSVGVILTFSSSFGQTYFIAIFAAQIMAAYDLSDGQWGALYTLSTTASALMMFWAGALTDRFRVRGLARAVFPALAACCVAMALSTSVALLVVIVFFLRLLGQGMMSQLAVTAMARWFVARRGTALSISIMGFAAGQAVLPVVLAATMELIDWRTIWLGSALILLGTLPVVTRLLKAERTPQSLAAETPVAGMGGRHWTRRQVLRSPIFWLLLPLLLGPPSWGTALFFQQVHIAGAKGWALVEYLALIPLLTIVSIAATLVTGQLIDRFGSSWIMRLYLVPWILGFLLLWSADTIAIAAIAFVVFGIATGLQGTVITAFWSEYFGTRYIGAIKAASTSIMVLGSALGPGISGALIDLGHDFPSQMLWIAGYFAAALVLTWLAVARATNALLPAEIDVKRT